MVSSSVVDGVLVELSSVVELALDVAAELVDVGAVPPVDPVASAVSPGSSVAHANIIASNPCSVLFMGAMVRSLDTRDDPS